MRLNPGRRSSHVPTGSLWYSTLHTEITFWHCVIVMHTHRGKYIYSIEGRYFDSYSEA